MKRKSALIFTALILVVVFYGCKKDSDEIKGLETGTVIDVDGNTYKTVKIGFQWWMAENLLVAHFRNGEVIPEILGNSNWLSSTTGARCTYENDSKNDSIYGKLYNFYAIADSRNLCPVGWHVPANSEWDALDQVLVETLH